MGKPKRASGEDRPAAAVSAAAPAASVDSGGGAKPAKAAPEGPPQRGSSKCTSGRVVPALVLLLSGLMVLASVVIGTCISAVAVRPDLFLPIARLFDARLQSPPVLPMEAKAWMQLQKAKLGPLHDSGVEEEDDEDDDEHDDDEHDVEENDVEENDDEYGEEDASEPDAAAAEEEEEEEENTCKNKDAECEMWAARGECEINPGYMTANCQKACKVCGTAGGRMAAAKSCANRDSDCDFWAEEGECEANPGYMHTHCALACGACEAEPEEEDSQVKVVPIQTPAGAPLFLPLPADQDSPCHGCSQERCSSSSARTGTTRSPASGGRRRGSASRTPGG
jgi:hypothetical protein